MPMYTEAEAATGLTQPIPKAAGGAALKNQIVVEAHCRGQLLMEDCYRLGTAKEALFWKMMTPGFDTRIVTGICSFLSRHLAALRPIGTNAKPASVDFVLNTAGLRSLFHFIVDGTQVVTPRPHDPEIYLNAAGRLGLEPLLGCILWVLRPVSPRRVPRDQWCPVLPPQPIIWKVSNCKFATFTIPI